MSQPGPSSPEHTQETREARELRIYLRAIGDLVRLQILRQLSLNHEMSVTELARAVRVSQPLLSWHLGVLKRIDLVTLRRDGRLAWYSLNRQTLCSFRQRLDAWVEGDEGIHTRQGRNENAQKRK